MIICILCQFIAMLTSFLISTEAPNSRLSNFLSKVETKMHFKLIKLDFYFQITQMVEENILLLSDGDSSQCLCCRQKAFEQKQQRGGFLKFLENLAEDLISSSSCRQRTPVAISRPQQNHKKPDHVQRHCYEP